MELRDHGGQTEETSLPAKGEPSPVLQVQTDTVSSRSGSGRKRTPARAVSESWSSAAAGGVVGERRGGAAVARAQPTQELGTGAERGEGEWETGDGGFASGL